ncbi:MAG: SDR family NAD(P)-dependent oxidoreductase [Bacteroidota bacterium]|nr:SDR family NAD(P)-dependent oxidoreductase [Bacteroidota bacterium]
MNIALITGSSKGIGEAITKLLLNKKWIVYGFSRTNNIKHPNFYHTAVDLGDLTSLGGIILPQIKTDNTILLINNASKIGKIARLDKKLDSEISSEYNLNIISPTIMCNKFLAKYRSHYKIIFNISSGAAQYSIINWSTYCSSKAALEMLTNVIKNENHTNLKIFSVSPGIVDTDMQKQIRRTSKTNFPIVEKFRDYYKKNELESPKNIAEKLYHIFINIECFKANTLHLREIKV